MRSHGLNVWPVSRRRLLGGALAATGLVLPARLQAQGKAPASQGFSPQGVSPDGLSADGFRILHAKAAAATVPGIDGKAAPVSAYEGSVPGPLLRVRRGEEVRVRLVNDLPEPTAIHWHGVRLKNAMDGTPPLTQAAVKPGDSFDYRFVAPDAGTFWYHPPEQAGPGLYGMLIVEEPEPIAVDRDVAIILDAGIVDGTVLVNGAQAFQIPVRVNERIRLRLLNAATAGFFALRIDRHRATVMAIDGQPSQVFEARGARVALGPGNRADLFVDCTLTPGASAPLLVETATGPVPVAHLVYGSEPVRPSPLLPSKPLPPSALPDRIELRGALRPEFPGIAAAAANASGLASKPLFSAKRGRTVVLNIPNRTAVPQVTHVHGHSFRVLDRLDDGWTPYWLDTLAVEPKANDHVAFVADNPGKWLIRARAQTAGMLAWFEVT